MGSGGLLCDGDQFSSWSRAEYRTPRAVAIASWTVGVALEARNLYRSCLEGSRKRKAIKDEMGVIDSYETIEDELVRSKQ